MPLAQNSRIGVYQIIAPLGAGGMGEVYRAFDPKLNREVAIKILPESLAADAAARGRLEREARTIAALSHPNILGIFDFDIDGEIAYAVMELLDGVTLREAMVTPLPIRKALEYAQQIAAGLGAAHERSIIHRDLKPENVFVGRDGRIKILDFGLAKSTNPSAVSPTMQTTPALTLAGTILGTVGYMSPEQVRGEEADHRSDIFSFGAILFEMFAGRRAFESNSTIETMHAILKEDVPETTAADRDLPVGLERIVRRCLEKRPDERFQSARDVAFALDAIAPAKTEIRKAAAAPEPRSRLRTFAPVLIVAALLSAVGGAAFVIGQRSDIGGLPRLTRLTWERGTTRSARFSPDGTTIIYGAAWGGRPIRVFQTRLGSPESIPMQLPDADIFSVSPSGEMAIAIGRRFDGWIGYATLARAPLVGGVPRPVLDLVSDADWGPNQDDLAIVRRTDGKDRLEYPIGTVLYETTGYISHPRVSRSGEAIAFLDHPVYGDNRGSVALVDRQGQRRTLTKDWSGVEGLAWSFDEREVWFAAADGSRPTIRAVSRAGADREVWSAPSHLTILDVSPDGRALVTANSLHSEIRWSSEGDPQERDLSWFADSAIADMSADGKSVLLTRFDEGAGIDYQMGLRQVDRAGTILLGSGRGLRLSPDARWALGLTFSTPGLVAVPTGTGERRTLTQPGLTYQTAGWFPEGRRILSIASRGSEPAAAYVQDVAGGDARKLPTKIVPNYVYVVKMAADERFFALPPGGAPLVVPVTGEPSPIPGALPGDTPLTWTPDGRGVIVARPTTPSSAAIMQLDLSSGRSVVIRTVTVPDAGGLRTLGFAASSDGRNVIYGAVKYLTDLFLVKGLK